MQAREMQEVKYYRGYGHALNACMGRARIPAGKVMQRLGYWRGCKRFAGEVN